MFTVVEVVVVEVVVGVVEVVEVVVDVYIYRVSQKKRSIAFRG